MRHVAEVGAPLRQTLLLHPSLWPSSFSPAFSVFASFMRTGSCLILRKLFFHPTVSSFFPSQQIPHVTSVPLPAPR